MSLRARLALAVGAVALVALVGADLVTYSAVRSSLISQVDNTLNAAARSANAPGQGAAGRGPAASGGVGPQGGDASPGAGATQGASRGPAGDAGGLPRPPEGGNGVGLSLEVRSPDGRILTDDPSRTADGDEIYPRLPRVLPGLTSGSAGAVYFDVPSKEAGGAGFRIRAAALPGGVVQIFGLPLGPTDQTLGRLVLIELAVTGGALVVSVALGWWLVRLGLRPLSDVEETAADIVEGDLGSRVPGENPRTEVGRLAGVLNAMLHHIEQAFAQRDATEAELRHSQERLRRFIADASHELRTPLAAVAAYAELFSRGAAERPEDLGRVMSGIRSETDRMGRLVEDLLTLARLDEGLPIDRRPVELVSIAAESIAAARTVGPGWPVVLEASEPIELSGDHHRLRQVFDNLLSNVRAHTPEGTATKVRLRAAGDTAVIDVIDDGPGMDEAQMARVFERFYRADPSRTRASGRAARGGGTGLGLSIVSGIVGAHDGTVGAHRAEGGGLRITIRMPISRAGDPEPPAGGRTAGGTDQRTTDRRPPDAAVAIDGAGGTGAEGTSRKVEAPRNSS